MNVQLQRLAQPAVDVTLVDCPEILLKLFQDPGQGPLAPFSVLMIDEEIPTDGDLMLDATKLRLVTMGAPGLALLVGRRAKAWAPANADDPIRVEVTPAPAVAPAAVPSPAPGAGDLAFLAEARAKLKHADLCRALGGLLERVRALQPRGALRALDGGLGHRRRYVNAPDNFVSFTIQSRAIVVHARRSGAARMSKFKLADERRPYMRFRLCNAADLEAAFPLIEASWRRGA
ncbi:hypothetical protein [Phenylobacterium sp.]|uniref:hypothetical protein n=1 Tax=Phenylobacterium sp. TaxID=1871053 RepID=UPI002E154E9D